MRLDLVDDLGARYRVPASIAVNQLHVGGSPRVRFVRAYGAEEWFRVLDGFREPATVDLVGLLATDRDEVSIQDLLDALTGAALTAVALAHVANDGTDVAHLELLGSLPIITEPDGIDGTLVRVTLPLIPAGEWIPGSPDVGQFLLLDSGGIMLLDDGSMAIQQ